ncbi:MAG: SAM-dependent methyltransferase [Bacteroidetes bacterium HGW-Bacteroidetes-2]|jgi:SAM-dependent methyltransferase|nr:MAG: SAM-dependent methyltransferase [Bacteroidetes bacterium HGW-Bacteroidetes-2]
MQKDILGKALLDFFNGNYSEDIFTETSISEEDVLPLPYLFREFKDMPALEQKALQLAKGKVLDVGCGAGIHSLYLQEKGFEVAAIDTSAGAVKVCSLRGIKDVRNCSLLDLKNEKFDTILLLMNGTGIFGNLKATPKYLTHLKSLLNADGQILIDSSDLLYMFDEDEDGGFWVTSEKEYYGELTFNMRYKGKTSEEFEWLYTDFSTLHRLCKENELQCKLVQKGDHFDYLAKINLK